MADEQSKRFQLNKTDIKKIVTGMSIAVGGALLTYCAELLPNVDFGQYTAIAVAVFSVLINTARKFIETK
jgi:hypothetical protein